MLLDPIDYDVVELRELARQRGDRYLEDEFLWAEPSSSFANLAEVDHSGTWNGSADERQKPYLDELPETRTADALVRRWMTRLVDVAGVNGAAEALAYYESLGWVTESVERRLQDYLLAAGNSPDASKAALDGDTHVDSLARVIALAKMRSDEFDDETSDGSDTAESGKSADRESREETDVDIEGVVDQIGR